jgi:hypothetical protein
MAALVLVVNVVAIRELLMITSKTASLGAYDPEPNLLPEYAVLAGALIVTLVADAVAVTLDGRYFASRPGPPGAGSPAPLPSRLAAAGRAWLAWELGWALAYAVALLGLAANGTLPGPMTALVVGCLAVPVAVRLRVLARARRRAAVRRVLPGVLRATAPVCYLVLLEARNDRFYPLLLALLVLRAGRHTVTAIQDARRRPRREQPAW